MRRTRHNSTGVFDSICYAKLLFPVMEVPEYLFVFMMNSYTVHELEFMTEYGETDRFQVKELLCKIIKSHGDIIPVHIYTHTHNIIAGGIL